MTRVSVAFADCLRTVGHYDQGMNLSRGIIIIGSIIAALLVAVAIIGVLILNSLNEPRTAEERAAACMEAEGYPLDMPAKEIEGFTMDGMRAAAEKCGLDED